MATAGISVIGNVNVDLIVRPVTALPPPGMEWPVETVELRVGGAAGIAALALARLGWPPRLVGRVGEDHFGRFLLDELARAGIANGVPAVPGEATGVSIAFEAPGRDRSFLIELGSLRRFDRSAVPEDATAARFVLLCGYFNLPALRGRPTVELLREARAGGGTTLFDSGWDPAGWPPETRDELTDILPFVDVFLPNEMEASGLAGEADAWAAARALQRTSGGWAVVKRGAGGCLAVGPSGEQVEVPAPRVEVTDTTGAGDSFNAGLISGLAGGSGWPDALRSAVRVASTVISRTSADRYPTPEELLPA